MKDNSENVSQKANFLILKAIFYKGVYDISDAVSTT